MKKKLVDWWIGGASYSAEAQAVFTNIGGTLSTSVKNAIAAFVDAEVAAGRWTTHLDVFQLYGTALGSESQGLKNWISSSYTAQNNDSYTASANGYLMNTVNHKGVATNYNPTTGTKWTQTNAIHGVYVNRNDSTTDQRVLLGYTSNNMWYQRTVASRLDFLAPGMNNLNVCQVAGYANGYTQGLYTSVQEISGGGPNYLQRIYVNGSSVGTGTASLPTELNQSILVGGIGGTGAPFQGILSCYFAGAGTGFSVSGFYTNFLTLITTLGVKI